MSETVSTVPLDNLEQITGRIIELQQALQINAPNYTSLLHVIHVSLQRNEELTHLLTEEQIGIVCAGLTKRMNIVISEEVSKKKKGKAAKDIGLSDL